MKREALTGNTLYQSWLGTLLKPRRILNKLLASLSRLSLVHPRMRVALVRLMGVRLLDTAGLFIGANVYFDELRPERIVIGKNVIITEGTRILSHFYDTTAPPHRFYLGDIVIEDDAFIGMNVVFTHPVTVGRGAVVGANSVVTADVPPGVIACGNPCKVIAQRSLQDGE